MTAMANDPLRDLMRSTLEFYARFDWQPEVEGAVKVFQEEVGELIEAATDGTNHDHIAEEAADVLVTVIGVCAAAGVTPDQLIRQLYRVVDKNNAKTHDTHIYVDGKIRRRHPKPN
ncbi:MAG: MazG nucleotide pyrophosphohydrolase domain-containing protein [Anaerolineae bacterium]